MHSDAKTMLPAAPAGDIGTSGSPRRTDRPPVGAGFYGVDAGCRRPLSNDLVSLDPTPWRRISLWACAWSLPVIVTASIAGCEPLATLAR